MDKQNIKNAIEAMSHIPKTPIKVKINEGWLNQQIERGLIRKADYKQNGNNLFMGVNVEITDEVENYKFVYEGDNDNE